MGGGHEYLPLPATPRSLYRRQDPVKQQLPGEYMAAEAPTGCSLSRAAVGLGLAARSSRSLSPAGKTAALFFFFFF